jgi:uncharacterized protein YdaT
MKPSPSKSTKATGKKRGHEEAAAAATGAALPMSPPRADPSREWRKSKVKTEDLLALLNNGFIREKEVDMWRATTRDPYLMEKAEDEIQFLRGSWSADSRFRLVIFSRASSGTTELSTLI